MRGCAALKLVNLPLHRCDKVVYFQVVSVNELKRLLGEARCFPAPVPRIKNHRPRLIIPAASDKCPFANTRTPPLPLLLSRLILDPRVPHIHVWEDENDNDKMKEREQLIFKERNGLTMFVNACSCHM